MTDPRPHLETLQQRIAALSPERRALLEQRLQQQGLAPVTVAAPLTPQPRPPAVPLSPAQQNLWVRHQLNPESSAYHIGLSWQLAGTLDIAALERSLSEIVQRHESLRTQFVAPVGQPHQEIRSHRLAAPLPVTNLSLLPKAAIAAEVQRLTEHCVKQPFDLSRDPLLRSRLLRLDETTAILLLVLHHLVADGWSRGVLMRELATLYRDFTNDAVPTLPPLPIQYADYTLWQQQWLQSDACRTQLDYWRQQLSGLPALELPTDRPRPAVPNFTSRTCTGTLSSDCVTALKTLSQQAGTTLFMTLLAAFKLLLHRYSAQADIGVGVPVANRNHPEVEPLIGFFVNTLVLRTRFTDKMTFRELLQQVRQVTADAFQHSEVPFAKVVEALQPDRDLSQNPLFQVMFQLQSGYQHQNAAHPDLALPGLAVQQTWLDPGQTKFNLTWHGIEREDGLLLAVEYRLDLFDEARIQRMLGHFQTLLAGILANPDRPVAELPLLSSADRHQVLVTWNQTSVSQPSQCFHQRFEQQVEQTPDAIAVTDPTQQLTYYQLNRRANQLAHTLKAQGIRPETLVGVHLPRSVELLVALLGVVKAGGAYVPVDPSLPAERVRWLLADAQVSLIVTSGAETLGASLDGVYPTLDLIGDRDRIAQAPDHNLAVSLEPDNLAYVIYTSGSTGQPKGTLLTHQGLSNYLNWATQTYPVAEGGAPVQSAIGFDATVTSLFTPLLVGQTVTLLPETHEIEALTQALQAGDTFGLVKLTPAHLKALEPLVLSPSTHAPISPPAKALILGGEALYGRDITPWRQRFPQLRLVNEYGPTEAVVGCCIYDVPLDFNADTVPIGRPIANVQLYVLDPDLEPVPIGVPGELYIGGAGVARGYLNRPDLTAERFVPNPFYGKAEGNRKQGTGTREQGTGNRKNPELKTHLLEQIIKNPEQGQNPSTVRLASTMSSAESSAHAEAHPPIHSSTLYKTGDRVSYRPDGIIEYLGRMDDQIKLRGYRIEPGEIEAALCQHPQVAQAVVVRRDDLGAAAKLVAYVVKGQKAEEAKFKVNGSRSQAKIEDSVPATLYPVPSTPTPSLPHSLTPFLSQHLPAYMLPDHFVTLEALPLTVNGKVDRQALPRPEIRTSGRDQAARSLTATEQQLAAIWAEVLQRDAVGLHDNFFELGGDSILAMQIIARAHQIGLHLAPRQLFQHQTVAALVAIAEVRSTLAVSQEPVTGTVSLLPIQRDFFVQDLPEPHHYNQAVMVTINPAAQPELLAHALKILVGHHDGLRSRFFCEAGTWQQVIQSPDAVTIALNECDLSHLPTDAQTEALATATDDWQASLHLSAGPLLRAVRVRLGEQGDRLLLIAHHLLVDGVSWRILLADLATAYQQLAAGSEVLLPPKTHSIQSWVQQLVALAQSGYFEAERSHWRDVCIPTAAIPVDLEADANGNSVASMEEVVIGLDAAQTEALLAVATQTYQVQVNEVLLTVLGQTLKSWTQSSTVLIDLEGHGRDLDLQTLQEPSLDMSRTVGWLTTVYPLRLTMPSGAMAEQLRSVKEQFRSVPHQGMGYGMLRHLAAESDPALVSPAAISFNYLGQVRLDAAPNPQELIQSLAPESVGPLRSPLGSRRYLLEVIALIRDGQLQVIWRYSQSVHRRATLEALAQRYLATLQSYLAPPAQPAIVANYTPSDFAAARVNQAQLDQLFSKIRGH